VPILDLAHVVLLEGDLGQVHPLALREPVHVARRNLRQGDEGGAVVAEVGQADRVPGCLVRRLLAIELSRMLSTVALTIDSIM
jgi:hypothetical protein